MELNLSAIYCYVGTWDTLCAHIQDLPPTLRSLGLLDFSIRGGDYDTFPDRDVLCFDDDGLEGLDAVAARETFKGLEWLRITLFVRGWDHGETAEYVLSCLPKAHARNIVSIDL